LSSSNVRIGRRARILHAYCEPADPLGCSQTHAFWPDELSLSEVIAFTGARLVGHQQVTDAYLLGLAIRRGGALVTLDERIAALTEPRSENRKALEIVG
jgi:predicted nucleic acid-binding protein